MKSGSVQPSQCAKLLLNKKNSSCFLIGVFLIALMPALLGEAPTQNFVTQRSESNSSPKRLAVAVLSLENKNSDPQTAHWRYGIQRMLGEQLKIVKAVKLIPQDSAAYAFKQLDLSKDVSVSAEQAKRIGEITEAQRIVWGSYRKESTQWQAGRSRTS
jgi:TolB-like protein